MNWDDPRFQIRPMSSGRKPMGNVFGALVRMMALRADIELQMLNPSQPGGLPTVFRFRR